LYPTPKKSGRIDEPPAVPSGATETAGARGSAFRLGEYRIVREIGRGGMGIVYEAVQESLGRRVAVKVLPSGVLEDPRRKARFLREARAAATLDHPNIVPVHAVGEDGGSHYYAMLYIEGERLDRAIAELRRLRGDAGSSAAASEDAPPASEEAPIVAGPQSVNEASFDLGVGSWTISVDVDDDPRCAYAAIDALCSTTVEVKEPGGLRIPGDANGDCSLDISDAVAVLEILFLGSGKMFPCGDGSTTNPRQREARRLAARRDDRPLRCRRHALLPLPRRPAPRARRAREAVDGLREDRGLRGSLREVEGSVLTPRQPSPCLIQSIAAGGRGSGIVERDRLSASSRTSPFLPGLWIPPSVQATYHGDGVPGSAEEYPIGEIEQQCTPEVTVHD
jgi:hypothetical protein